MQVLWSIGRYIQHELRSQPGLDSLRDHYPAMLFGVGIWHIASIFFFITLFALHYGRSVCEFRVTPIWLATLRFSFLFYFFTPSLL